MSPSEYHRRIAAFLEDHGINDFRFERRAKHPAVIVRYEGIVYSCIFPGTASDRRSILNTISYLRRTLGLVTPASAGGAKPKDHSRPRARPAPESRGNPRRGEPVERGDRYYAPLQAIREQLLKEGASLSNVTTIQTGDKP